MPGGGDGVAGWGFYNALQQMRAGAIVEHDLFQRYDQPTGIARRADLSQTTEQRQHVAFRHAVAYKNADLLMSGWHGVLEHCAQLFVELLSGAHAGEFDL